MADQSRLRPPDSGNGSRMRRYVLSWIAFLCLILILTPIFLHQTSVGSPKFVKNTLFLWTATVLVVLALLILATVLGRNLIKLYFDRKSGKVGSRFKIKMVTMFVALSLLPALLLFFLAYGLINFSIEQWFSAPAAQMLENSKALAKQYYDETQQRASHFALGIAASLDSSELLTPKFRSDLESTITHLRLQYGLDSVRVFDRKQALVGETGTHVSHRDHDSQLGGILTRALAGEQEFQVEQVSPKDALKQVIWATAPIRDGKGEIFGVVVTELLIPESVYFKAYSVMEAYEKYDQLQREKVALRFNVFLILALSTILTVFAFSWFAMYLAKRITVPIQALAEGSAAVAAGDLDHRVQCEASDELGNLVVSFNRMTGELQENKANIEAAQHRLAQTNVELDDRRRYIETVLQAIATGVISLDSDYRLRTMNRTAAQMLGLRDPVVGKRLEEVVQGSACSTLWVLFHKAAILGPVVRTIELALPGRTLNLATTVTPLVDSSGKRTGWVLVLDDVTELLRAEKMAAWQEVARRLAHEIKNPLTPIQLSAERILRRYKQILEQVRIKGVPADSLPADFASYDSLLEECVRTITQEADTLKNLVNEFSRFARLPVARLEETDIHRILENTLSLYNGRIHEVRVHKVFESDIPPLLVDPEQMKRVFINLFDNALEAMAENSHARILQIRTVRNALQESIRVEISDTGRGFPKEYQDSLFLPYFSTRKGGTGLGLAIVRQIISDHHGSVRAEPNLPLGTRIVIDLPLTMRRQSGIQEVLSFPLS